MAARNVLFFLFSATILAAFVCVVPLAPAQTLTTLVGFDGTNGLDPLGTLVQGSDGNFYGTTIDGGANFACSEVGCGTVFKMTPTGTLTTLYNFCAQPNCTDGAMPQAGLVQGTDGNFYGTTTEGGPHSAHYCGSFGCGTVFKITPTGTLTTLYSFCAETNCADGAVPYAALVQGTDGNFYGTTAMGGVNCVSEGGCGTVFKITSTGTLTTLYSFCTQTNCPDGIEPEGTLVQGRDGDFYGTTLIGGNSTCTSFLFGSTCGTVFKITPTGTLTTLYRFCTQAGCTDGSNPQAGLVQATDGNFYGTTVVGGANCVAYGGCGTVFKITAAGAYTTLSSFCVQYNCTDGENPFGGLVQASDGNFYGTTTYGGINPNNGTVFRITPTGALATLYWFPGGDRPFAAMVQGSDGNLYGSTTGGGEGTIFRLSLAPSTVFSVLHTFTGTADGGNPVAGLTVDPSGILYGAAATGGTGSCAYLDTTGCGTLYQLKKHNSSFEFSPLYSFRGGSDGEFPVRPVIEGPNGTLYGTTVAGGEGSCTFDGAPECGVVFNAGPNPTPPRTPLLTYRESVLYRFPNGSEGASPYAPVIFDSSGNIYTTTMSGGANGLGAVVKLTPSGGGNYTESVIYSFAGGSDGENPMDGMVFDTAGNLYGTTAHGGNACAYSCGTVFKLSPNGSDWTEQVIYAFRGAGDGMFPNSGVVLDAAGNIYGNTYQGGSVGGGTVYELTANGSSYNFNVLFTVPMSSGNAVARVTLDSAGNVYDVLQSGGAFGVGEVWKLTLSQEQWLSIDLHDFSGGTDGATPLGQVSFDSNGNIYGTAAYGAGNGCGGSGCGIVWEITP